MTEADEVEKKLRVVARTAAVQRIDALRSAGIDVVTIDSLTCLVGRGRFVLHPGNGFWKAVDGKMQGYTVASLRAAYETTLLNDVAEQLALPAPPPQQLTRGEVFAQRFLTSSDTTDTVADRPDAEAAPPRDNAQPHSDPDSSGVDEAAERRGSAASASSLSSIPKVNWDGS